MPDYKRILLGILMIIGLPVIIALGVAAFGLALGVFIVFGVLCGGFMAAQTLCQSYCFGCIAAIICCPLITVGVLIGLVIRLLVEGTVLAI